MSLQGGRIVHPGTADSMSVAALRAAMGAARHRDEHDWLALLETGYRVPKLQLGHQVDVEDIAVMVDYVSERAERAAETAVVMHEGLTMAGVAEPRLRREVVGGLAQFIVGARGWVAAARRHGGPARVEAGMPTIVDASLPEKSPQRGPRPPDRPGPDLSL